MAMMKEFTRVFQSGSDITIDLHTRIMGVEAKIYFPQEFGHYSGNNNDIKFKDSPDLEGKVLIPDFYNLSKTPRGGVTDVLFQDSFKMYLKHNEKLPDKSKIVVVSPYIGTLQFLVKDQESPNTFFGIVYREYTITPYLNFESNIEDHLENSQALADSDYNEFKESNPHNDDLTISKSNSNAPSYKFRKVE